MSAARTRLALARVLAWTLLCAPLSAAEMVTEVIPAGFRDAGELAAVLGPLVPAPGSVSGFAGQLIIKTTPENMAELKQLLVTLDRAPANLLVTVKHSLDSEISRDLAQARIEVDSRDLQAGVGRVGAGGGAGVQVQRGDLGAAGRIRSSTSTRRENDAQSVRVLEGKEAFIHSGESVPVGERSVVITGAGVAVSDGVRYEEFGSGFFVRPRLNGDVVTLEVFPNRRQRRGDGSAAVQEASTTVSGRLGRWMEIGGVSESTSRSSRGLGTSRTTTTRRDGRIFVKVQRLD